MSEQKSQPKEAAAAAPVTQPKGRAEKPPKKKKTRPTNCAFSNKRIRRKDWYYRNGKYFANKKSFKLDAVQQAEKALKAKEAAAAIAAKPAEPAAVSDNKPASPPAPAAG